MPSLKLGNIRNGDISREILVAVHSEGKEARKLDFLESSEQSSRKEGILGDFTLPGQIDTIYGLI